MRVLLIAVAVLLFTIPAFAGQSVVGGMVDAPNLVRFSENLTLGLEGGKEVYHDIFKNDSVRLEDDEGYFGFVKVTYTGTLFSFSK